MEVLGVYISATGVLDKDTPKTRMGIKSLGHQAQGLSLGR